MVYKINIKIIILCVDQVPRFLLVNDDPVQIKDVVVLIQFQKIHGVLHILHQTAKNKELVMIGNS